MYYSGQLSNKNGSSSSKGVLSSLKHVARMTFSSSSLSSRRSQVRWQGSLSQSKGSEKCYILRSHFGFCYCHDLRNEIAKPTVFHVDVASPVDHLPGERLKRACFKARQAVVIQPDIPIREISLIRNVSPELTEITSILFLNFTLKCPRFDQLNVAVGQRQTKDWSRKLEEILPEKRELGTFNQETIEVRKRS